MQQAAGSLVSSKPKAARRANYFVGCLYKLMSKALLHTFLCCVPDDSSQQSCFIPILCRTNKQEARTTSGWEYNGTMACYRERLSNPQQGAWTSSADAVIYLLIISCDSCLLLNRYIPGMPQSIILVIDCYDGESSIILHIGYIVFIWTLYRQTFWYPLGTIN